MPKDILVRGVDDKTIEYLETYRRQFWGQQSSWSSVVGGILNDWVRERELKRAREQERDDKMSSPRRV